MKHNIPQSFKFQKTVSILLFCICFQAQNAQNTISGQYKSDLVAPYSSTEYVVLAHKKVLADTEWNKVAQALSVNHGNAPIVQFDNQPTDAREQLKTLQPRYVAIVDMPANIGYRYVIAVNQLSRQMDDDIYSDFLWGIITGYDAKGALNTVNNAIEPLVLQSALSTSSQIRNAQWVERYAWIDDNGSVSWGEKKSAEDTPATYPLEKYQILDKFKELYKSYDPDLLITASHAAENVIEMPYGVGMLFAEPNGRVSTYPKNDPFGYLYKSVKRKVFLPVGNCLIGNVNNTTESQVVAWMNDQAVATFVGYVVATWFGRGGWGMLKYFVTNPGRHTPAEAFFFNQKDMMYIMNNWNNRFHTISYPFAGNKLIPDYMGKSLQDVMASIGHDWNRTTVGFLHDRDVVAFYGDPAWNVRLKSIAAENDYTVTAKVENKQYVITIVTDANFSYNRMKGGGFVQAHAGDIPFSFFFPQRLKNPRLAAGQTWETALDENSILLYNSNFEPNKTYTVVLDIDNALPSGAPKTKPDLARDIVVSGKKIVSLSDADFSVFGIDGKNVGKNSDLATGIYIVKTKNGNLKVKIE